MKYNYKAVKRPDGTTVKTPSIPITLRGKEDFYTIGLLDSGADVSAVPREIAEILGLDLSAGNKPAHGIGGKVDATDSKMHVSLRKGHESYDFEIPVKVIMGNYEFPVLLGRTGIFDKFTVTFDQAQEKVSLKRNTRQ
jgi:hypothetical protein